MNSLKEIKPGDILVRISSGWILIVLETEPINYKFWQIKFLNTKREIKSMLFDDVDLNNSMLLHPPCQHARVGCKWISNQQ